VIDDGVIKYNRSNFTHTGPLSSDIWKDLELWREKLFQLNLIGEYPIEKVGFGNVSKLTKYKDQAQFVITGTQTGKHENLDGKHYTMVLGHDLLEMDLISKGPVEPSSEALTHAAIYESNKDIKAVFHIHSDKIWNEMINNNYPSTKEDTPYGTFEMATEVKGLIQNQSVGVIVMKGHHEGVIAYGKTLDETGEQILQLAKKFL
jgi:ribulose-5-phosphate 4-epimerase/fuculose-1-phosphate aldolase